MTILNIRQHLDPCQHFKQHKVETLVTAMGNLPKCIDLNSPVDLVNQVMAACHIISPYHHKLGVGDVDKDGTFELNGAVSHAVGLMSRMVAGDFQAIYYYSNGDVIVVNQNEKYLFHMDG